MRNRVSCIEIGDQIPCIIVKDVFTGTYESYNAVVITNNKVINGEYALTVSCKNYFDNVKIFINGDYYLESLRLQNDTLKVYCEGDVLIKVPINVSQNDIYEVESKIEKISEPKYKRIITFEKYIYEDEHFEDNSFVMLANGCDYSMVSTTIIPVV